MDRVREGVKKRVRDGRGNEGKERRRKGWMKLEEKEEEKK